MIFSKFTELSIYYNLVIPIISKRSVVPICSPLFYLQSHNKKWANISKSLRIVPVIYQEMYVTSIRNVWTGGRNTMQTMKRNVLFTGIIKNEFGLHFNQNKLNSSYKDTAAYFWLVSNLVFPISLFKKHRPGFHSQSGAWAINWITLRKGKKRKNSV